MDRARRGELRGDRRALITLKTGLRDRLRARPGWDIKTYVRDFEQALAAMWPSA